MNSFASSHDHYVASAASGIPTLAMFASDKRHITEHLYAASDIVSFINGNAGEALEEIPEWSTYTGPATSTIDRLQAMGLTPSFRAAGVPVICEDWIPENYMLTIALPAIEPPLTWRIPEGEGMGVENLMVFSQTASGPTPNSTYQWIEDYIRWTSATVTAPGAGVARYLNGASWTDATGWIAAA
jgi:hypothetical protein